MKVLVVGATDEALEIIKKLVKKGHEVVVLDDNKSRIDKVVQELDVAAYIFSVIDIDVFHQAGMHKADLVIAIHPIDTVNILTCALAKYFNVPRIYAIANTNEAANILQRLGLVNDVLIKSKALVRVLLELLYNTKLIDFDEDNYLVLATVKEGSHLDGKTVEDIEEEGAKVLTIISDDNNVINFDKNHVFKKNEKVLLIIRKDKIESFAFKY